MLLISANGFLRGNAAGAKLIELHSGIAAFPLEKSFLERLREPTPLNFAHRGARNVAPENTLAAFERAVAQGADGLELDIRLCKTNEWVVLHDATLNRTTNGRGYVRTKSLEDLRRLSAGSWFNPRFAKEKIPTLNEVLELAQGRCLLNIEVKAMAAVQKRHLACLLESLYRHRAERRCIISSFNPLVLRRVSRLDAALPTGLLLTGNLLSNGPKATFRKFTGVQALHLHARVLSPRLIERVRRLGLHLLVWGADTSPAMKRMIRFGVDGIITDDPLILHKLLRRNSLP